MRIHRIFVPQLAPGETVLTGREAHHLANVLRVQVGAHVLAFDGRGQEAEGTVKASGARVVLELAPAQTSSSEPLLNIHLAIGLLKGDKLADVVRKCTELGVKSIQPFTSQHGDVRVLSKNKLERLRRVAQEAAKQSGRSFVPTISEPVNLSALNLLHPSLTAHPYASATLNDVWDTTPATITLVTGPEGGLSEDEVTMLIQKGTQTVRLGSRILRAETAPVAVLAALLVPGAL